MTDGIILLITFIMGLLVGLKLEYKHNPKKTIDEDDNLLEKTNEKVEDDKSVSNPTALTSEIIDEWMNGSDNNE